MCCDFMSSSWYVCTSSSKQFLIKAPHQNHEAKPNYKAWKHETELNYRAWKLNYNQLFLQKVCIMTTNKLLIEHERTWTSAIPSTLILDADPLTCNAVTRKFCANHDRRTMGVSSSSTNGSPADWPRSSNNSPPATLTGTCPGIREQPIALKHE